MQTAWSLLTDIESWPQWWPQVTRVRVLHKVPAGDIGTELALTWRKLPGCGFTTLVVNTRQDCGSDGHAELEGRWQGNLPGHGLWVLDAVCAREVDVTCRYEVLLNKHWMRALAPLLRSVFAWNHFAEMRSAARGMAARLNCRSSKVVNWLATPIGS